MLTKKNLTIFLLFAYCFAFAQKEDNGAFSTTKSGLQYKILKKGNGKFAHKGNRIWVHYIGKLSNDSVFESTRDKGELDFYLGCGQLIKGWEEGLKLVSEGGIIELVIPPKLGYGNLSYKGINPEDTLIFDIALLQIDPTDPIKPYNISDIKPQKTDNGIIYYPIKKGEGKKAQIGDNAYIHYTGFLSNGDIFETTAKKAKPIRVTVGSNNLFRGWNISLQQMNKGSKYRFIIPYKLAYGKKGYKNIIPPKSDLTMEIEMVDIIPEIKVSKWDATGKDTITTKSGLRYIIFKQGEGKTIKDSCIVKFDYSAFFTNGRLFNSSVKRNEPMQMPIGINAIIEGIDDALKLMKKGAEYQFIIPYKLAYGEEGIKGKVPPKADLIFDIKVIEVIF